MDLTVTQMISSGVFNPSVFNSVLSDAAKNHLLHESIETAYRYALDILEQCEATTTVSSGGQYSTSDLNNPTSNGRLKRKPNNEITTREREGEEGSRVSESTQTFDPETVKACRLFVAAVEAIKKG